MPLKLAQIRLRKKRPVLRLVVALLLIIFATTSFFMFRSPAHAYSTDAFVMVIKTDNPGTSSSAQFTIPTTGTGYNYSVDCNDDGVNEVDARTASYTCVYASAGTYTVAITGNFPRIYFGGGGDRQKLLEVQQWGSNAWTSMDSAFRGATNLRITATDAPNLSGVTSMAYMFSGATNMNDNINHWNTSTVISMYNMFDGATAFNQPLGNWDTANVNNMYFMFSGARAFNQPIGSWNTSNVTTMSNMFQNARAFNQPLGGWDTSKVTNMSNMFSNAIIFNQPIGSWNTSNVTNMSTMFRDAYAFNQPIGNWNTSNVTNMSGMFDSYGGNMSFDQPIGTWDTSKVTDMSYMFGMRNNHSSAFKADISAWNLASVTTMANMFRGASLPYRVYDAMLASWSAQAVKPGVQFNAGNSIYTNTSARSILTSSPNNWTITDSGHLQPRSSAFVMRVKTDNSGTSSSTQFTVPTNVGSFGASLYNYNVDCDDDGTSDHEGATGSVTCTYPSAGTYTLAITGLFPHIYFNGVGDRQKLLEVQQWGSNAWTSMTSAFSGAANLRITATDAPNLGSVASMHRMFEGATSMNDNISHWDTSKVTEMGYVFYRATAFNQPLDSWNTSNVTSMNGMFYLAASFNQPIGNWNTGKVTSMSSMFQDAYAFNQPIGNWNTANVTNMADMFTSYGGNMSFNQPVGAWNTSKVTNMSYMFGTRNGRSAAFKADVSEWNIANVTNMAGVFQNITLPYKIYDAMLASWSAQAVKPGVQFHAGNSKYTNTAARSILTSAPNGWVITDGGPNTARINGFVIKVKTDNPGTSTSTQFTIPTRGTGYSYAVDCNDDGTNEATAQTTSYTCTYAIPGTYTIVISGTFPRIYFNNTGDRQKLLEVQQWGSNAWTSMERAFYGASNLQVTATDTPNLSNVTNMSSMFAYTPAFNSDLSGWNTGSVTDMSYMFFGANAFNGDISSWNTGSVINMAFMFYSARAFNGDLSTWDTSNVTSMSYMFYSADTFNGDISSWNTGSVTDMSYMFMGAPAFNGDISSWDTGSVAYMSNMFYGASAFNGDLSNWNISNVTNMTNMFRNVTLPYKTYDAILTSWSQQTVKPGVQFHAGNSQYTNAAARAILTSSPNNWVITDAGSPAPTITAPTAGARLVTNTPTITGTAVAGATVDITIAGQTLTATADNDGNWSVTTGHIADGTYDITASVGDSDDTTVTGITIVSPAPTITAPTAGARLVTNTPTITGTAVAGATVDITIAGQTLTVIADDDGNWSVVTGSIFDGTYEITAKVASSDLATVSGVTIVSPAPTITAPSSGTILTTRTPTITGTATSGAIVAVAVGTQNLTTTADNNGNWSVTAASLTDGTYTVIARVASSEVATVTISIKLPVPIVQPDKPILTPQKPSAGQVPVPAPSGRRLIATVEPDGTVTVRTPTLTVNGDKPIDQNPTIPSRPTFSGTATPGAQVKVVLNVDGVGCQALTDENSRWQCTLREELRAGTYTIRTGITNPDGTTIELTPYTAEVLGVRTEEGKELVPGTGTAEQEDNPANNSTMAIVVAAVLSMIAASTAFVRWRKNSIAS